MEAIIAMLKDLWVSRLSVMVEYSGADRSAIFDSGLSDYMGDTTHGLWVLRYAPLYQFRVFRHR